MNRVKCAMALVLCMMVLFLAGCGGEQPGASVGTDTNAQQDTMGVQTEPQDQTGPADQTQPEDLPANPSSPTQPEETKPSETEPEETMPATESTGPNPTVPMVPQPDDPVMEELKIEDTGKKRITYTVNISSVRYVTSPAALPEYPEFASYDEAWFRSHALVIVYETVASGTVEVDIDRIVIRDGNAAVELTHEVKGGLGTADMTTWILWAEVESGLDYSWSVENPAMDSNVTDR